MVGIKGEEAGKTTLRKRGNDREEVRKKEKTTSIENYGIRRLEWWSSVEAWRGSLETRGSTTVRERNIISSWNVRANADQMPGTVRERIEVRSNFTCNDTSAPLWSFRLNTENLFRLWGEKENLHRSALPSMNTSLRARVVFQLSVERPLQTTSSPPRGILTS